MTTGSDIVVAGRRRLLREWIASRYGGVQASFIADTGINQGELSGLLKDKSFGEKRARSLEQKARMPPFYLDRPTAERAEPADEIRALQRQVESLTVVLAALVSVTAKHRPLEGAGLAQLIRGNQSLDLTRQDLVADMLDLIEPAKPESATPTARARKRSAS